MSAPPTDPGKPAPSDSPIRVMLVDDSAVVRGLLSRILEEDPGIKIVTTASNGQQAVDIVVKAAPHIIILDVEMPVMDGLTALPLLLKAAPESKILVCSTLTLRNAEITLKALAMGATDTIAKPTSAGNIIGGSDDFKGTLLNMVKQIATSTVRRQPALDAAAAGRPLTSSMPAASKPASGVATTAPAPRIPSLVTGPIRLRDLKTAYNGKPAIVAIGSSTGGPQALFTVLKACTTVDVPIVITQHMPATFTAMLAQHIQQNSGLPSGEGKEGEVLKPGHVYVAPGGHHMLIQMENGAPTIRLNTNPPENFCRPAVDPMFRSLAEAYGNKVLAVILTGMGSDGAKGGGVLVEAGARLFAQDEPSSVVWGMPGAAANAGICHGVLPLPEIGPMITKLVTGR